MSTENPGSAPSGRIITGRNGHPVELAAAVTRSMLGYGVLAGPFYLVFALILGLTREGFDFSRHALSLLMLGDGGWLQVVNLALTGVMVVVAGLGIRRAADGARGAGVAVVVAGVATVLAAVFPPDPVSGFPVDAEPTATASGILHLAAGGVQMVAFAVGAFLAARVWATRGASWSRVAGVVILVAFVGGAAVSGVAMGLGVALIWLAVLTAFAWLLVTSLRLYGVVPHPDLTMR
ncbi:DUF998 domain-containing protein [Myceligenerans crystallogenes]|uniref:DUF998 domain-containing protein n=1 Tax=Myceligenerans crystallogenes TaxID=316335 RepID=A0ABN2NMK9_9MICO